MGCSLLPEAATMERNLRMSMHYLGVMRGTGKVVVSGELRMPAEVPGLAVARNDLRLATD